MHYIFLPGRSCVSVKHIASYTAEDGVLVIPVIFLLRDPLIRSDNVKFLPVGLLINIDTILVLPGVLCILHRLRY